MFARQMVGPLRRMGKNESPDSENRFCVDEFIEAVQVEPHFHPIIDVFTGLPLGFEILSRGVSPWETPDKMFNEAWRRGATWELEKACRVAALKKIAGLPEKLRSLTYFINVSPEVFTDSRFIERFTQARLQEYGIDQSQIVIEITERMTFPDPGHFEKLISHYTAQNFKIALDDFGSGYSGLITLIASTPHYLKLDMAIVRDVHKHEYKQKLVRAMVSFASSVNTRLIAEGVESTAELEVLVKYGVRYVQGFLFGKPQSEPYFLSGDLRKSIFFLVKKYDLSRVDMDEQLKSLVIRPLTIEKDNFNCQQLGEMFQKTPYLNHLVILDGEKITGLITKQHFYNETGGAFGYQLHQKKPVESICKKQPLVVEDKITVTTLAKLAMARFQEDLYDPVLVVDCENKFVGSVTMQQVITKAAQLEIRYAMNANPLTNLPGNEVIRRWIRDALLWPEYSIIYVDLDNFKGYNDSYGFLMGDELLRFTAKVLSLWRESLSETMLGHIGGDDFVIVSRKIVQESSLAELCRMYDQQKIDLFKPGDAKRGFMRVNDRQGNQIKVPLVTMSLAVITSSNGWVDPHPALFSEVAASLKKKVKRMTNETGQSGFMFERRLHQDETK